MAVASLGQTEGCKAPRPLQIHPSLLLQSLQSVFKESAHSSFKWDPLTYGLLIGLGPHYINEACELLCTWPAAASHWSRIPEVVTLLAKGGIFSMWIPSVAAGRLQVRAPYLHTDVGVYPSPC